MFEISKIFNKNNTVEDDLKIIRAWTEYSEDRSETKYMMYELEMEDESGNITHFFKAVKLLRIIRLPKSSKQSRTFMKTHARMLQGVWQQNIKLITIIANILNPIPFGLMYLYGVQGVALTEDEAKHIADNDFVALMSVLQGSYRVLEYKTLSYEELEMFREKMFSMKNLSVVRGIPKAKESGRKDKTQDHGKGSGMKVDPDEEDTTEEFIAGMSDREYVVQILSTPVKSEHLERWLAQTAQAMTMYNSQVQGNSSIGFKLSVPMMYMANLGASQGWSHSYTESQMDSVSISDSLSSSVSTSIGENTSQAFGESVGHSYGESISDSIGHSYSSGINTGDGTSWGSSTGLSQGISNNFSENVSIGDTYTENNDQGIGTGTSTNANMNIGSSIDHSTSHSTTTTTTDAINSSQSSSITNTQTMTKGESSSTGGSLSNTTGKTESDAFSQTNTISKSESNGTSMDNTTDKTSSFSEEHSYSDTYGSSQSTSSKSEVEASFKPFGVGVSAKVSSESSSESNESHGSSHSYGSETSTSNSTSIGSTHTEDTSVSTSTSNTHSSSTSTSVSESENYSNSQQQSVSNGQSVGSSQSTGKGHSEAMSKTDSYGQSIGSNTSVGQGIGSSDDYNKSQSQAWGQNVGQSQGSSVGQNQNASMNSNVGGSSSTTGGESWGMNNSSSYGQSKSDNYSQSANTNHTKSFSENNGSGQSQNWGSNTGSSKGTAMGTTGGMSSGTSSSVGVGPSVGFTISYQWIDQEVKNILTLLEFQNMRLMKALRGDNGAFFTDIYIATPDEKSQVAASILAKGAWSDERAMVCPLQVLNLNREEQEHLLYHFAAFSADNTKVNDENNMQSYKYSTILLPNEFTAYTHLPRISDGGVYADVGDVPKFAVPSMRKGDIYMGKILSGERWTPGDKYETIFEYRLDEGELMHGIFTGESRSGKTVAATRFVAELTKVRRSKTGKRLRIVALDPKQDWRVLGKFVEPERFHFYSLGNPEFLPINLNICKVPHNVNPQVWIDGVIEIFCRSYGLLERGKAILAETFYSLYDDAGVFEDSPNWRDFVPERSAKVTMAKVFNRMQQIKLALDDSLIAKRGRTGNEAMDAYACILDRLQVFSRKFSIEARLFAREDGIAIDELIGGDDVIVLESYGLETTFKNFIFGCITSGFFKYAQGHEGGFLAPDQYETVLIVEEANEVLTGSDTAGQNSGGQMGLGGQSEFEKILDQSAGLGLFIIAITQKIADMPSSCVANAGLVFAGKISRQDDVTLVIRKIGREERYDDRDILKWFPRSPIGWFVCRSSRNYNFKDTEPILVHIDPVGVNPPSNAELEGIMVEKKAMALLNA